MLYATKMRDAKTAGVSEKALFQTCCSFCKKKECSSSYRKQEKNCLLDPQAGYFYLLFKVFTIVLAQKCYFHCKMGRCII